MVIICNHNRGDSGIGYVGHRKSPEKCYREQPVALQITGHRLKAGHRGVVAAHP